MIELLWDAPSNQTDLHHYLVYMKDEHMEYTSYENHFLWTGLTACTNYTFGVKSVSATGNMSCPILGEGQTLVGCKLMKS